PIGTAPDDGAGIGIAVEADASVSGNVIENAPVAGIMVGWGAFMRDVSVTGNVVRDCRLRISVSVVNGAGTAVIAGNLISGSPRGAIVGMDHAKAVTGDLSRSRRATPTCRSAATGCGEVAGARSDAWSSSGRMNPCVRGGRWVAPAGQLRHLL